MFKNVYDPDPHARRAGSNPSSPAAPATTATTTAAAAQPEAFTQFMTQMMGQMRAGDSAQPSEER